MIKIINSVIISLVLGVVYCDITTNFQFTTRDKFGKRTFGTIEVRNNVWGFNPGPQELFANSGSNWAVKCSHTGPGVKSYPNSGQLYNKPLSSINALTSSYSVTTDIKGAGVLAYTTTYDIWVQKHAYEVMLWCYYFGAILPLGPLTFSNVALGGHNWNVYKGNNTKNQVYSFVALQPSKTKTIDLKAILNWIIVQGWFAEKNAVILDEVQFGFEISSTPPNALFFLENYDVKAT